MRYYAATYQTTTYRSTNLHSLVMLLHRLGAGIVYLSPEIDLPKPTPKDWIRLYTIEDEETENQE